MPTALRKAADKSAKRSFTLGYPLTTIIRSRSLLSYSLGSLTAVAAVALLTPSIGVAETASVSAELTPLGTGKKGGEPCESGAECETGVCKDEKCDPCPSRENCPPPGVCTQADYEVLRRQKLEACGRDHSCKPPVTIDSDDDVDCLSLMTSRANAKACVDSRLKIMDDCFMGGNQGHVVPLDQAKRALEKCDEIIETKMRRNACYECSDYGSLRDDADKACGSPTECAEKKNDAKADCGSMRRKIQVADECKETQKSLAIGCFNGNYSKKRLKKLGDVTGHESHCRDVLDFKEGKKLCK